MSARARRILAVVVTLVLVCAAAASAYYTAHGSGHANAGVGTLSAPSIASATPGAGTVALSWSAVTPPASGSVTYYVRRDGGAASAACPSQASPSGVTSCTDTGVAVGTHTYTVTAVWRTWTATSTGANATVASGPVASLVVTTQPGGTITGGSAFPTQPVITAKDASNNTVLNYSGTVALSIKSGTGAAGAALSGCSGSLSNGVTTFSGCKIDLASATAYKLTASDGTRTVDTSSFTVGVGPVAQIGFVQQPTGATGGSAFATQAKVAGQDAGGNTVTSYAGTVTLAIKSGTGTAGAALTNCSSSRTNGVVTFAGCQLDKVGTGYQLHASDGTRTADSAAFDVTAGPMASLAFTTQPSNATGGTPFPTQPVVTALDAGGNVATGYAGTIALSIRPGSPSGTLHGCAQSRSNGVVTFSGCTIDEANTGYRLRAKDGATADSTTFNVTVGPLATLSLATSATQTAGTGTDVVVTALDAGGNTVTSYTGSHNLTFGGASAGPSGTLPTVVNGSGTAIAFGSATALTFASGVSSTTGTSGTMTLHKAETASLTVTDGTAANGAGLAVTVSPGASASKLAFTSVSVSAGTLGVPCLFTCTVSAIGTAGGTFTARVSATDADGNVVSGLGASKTVTVARSAGTGAFTSPTSGTSVTVTIPSSGAATSTASFTFQTPTSGTWTANTFAASVSGFASATATLSRT